MKTGWPFHVVLPVVSLSMIHNGELSQYIFCIDILYIRTWTVLSEVFSMRVSYIKYFLNFTARYNTLNHFNGTCASIILNVVLYN